MLLNYLTLIARDFVDSGSIFRRWNRSASIGANMLQAHTPELYVSWIFSADSGDLLYQNATKYTILYVDTPADLTLIHFRLAEQSCVLFVIHTFLPFYDSDGLCIS